MTDTPTPATYVSLCDRSARLACALIDQAPLASLRFSERARLRRTLRKLLGHLRVTDRLLVELDTHKEAAPPLRD